MCRKKRGGVNSNLVKAVELRNQASELINKANNINTHTALSNDFQITGAQPYQTEVQASNRQKLYDKAHKLKKEAHKLEIEAQGKNVSHIVSRKITNIADGVKQVTKNVIDILTPSSKPQNNFNPNARLEAFAEGERVTHEYWFSKIKK